MPRLYTQVSRAEVTTSSNYNVKTWELTRRNANLNFKILITAWEFTVGLATTSTCTCVNAYFNQKESTKLHLKTTKICWVFCGFFSECVQVVSSYDGEYGYPEV